jgi:hypothetical protein
LGLSALWTILERHPDYSEAYGPERLAFLHIQAEAVWVCSTVWGRLDERPFGVVLQDYDGSPWPTLGGTGDLFGEGKRTVRAEYLLVAENTDPWPDYEQVSDLTEKRYGMKGCRVQLFLKRNQGSQSNLDDDVIEYI